MKSLPPELINDIIDIATYIATAAIGWFARWLAKGKQEKQIIEEKKQLNEENEKLKTIFREYDTAARESLRYARKPKAPEE